MSFLYYNIEASIDSAASDIIQFGLVVVFLGIAVLLPSLFEKKP